MLKRISNTKTYEHKDGVLMVFNYGDLTFSEEVEEFMIEDTIFEFEEEGIIDL